MIGRSVLSGCMDALMYLLWVSSLGVSQRLFTGYLSDSFRAEAVTVKLNRLHRKGFISKIKKGRNAFIRATLSRVDTSLSAPEKLKRENCKNKWDGVWRLLVYDIPEKERGKRDRLRLYLKNLGFGKIQGSCWVSPYDFSGQIHAFCANLNILRYICLYEGKFFAGKNTDVLVEEVWGLNKIHRQYQEFIELCESSQEKIRKNDILPHECCKVYFKIYSAFSELTRNDPFLPRDFLKKWPYMKTEDLFNNFSRLVAKKLFPDAQCSRDIFLIPNI